MRCEFRSRQVIGACFPAADIIIEFTLPEKAAVTLSILDEDGRMIEHLMEDVEFAAGGHEIRFDNSRCADGTYYYRLAAKAPTLEVADTRKIV